MNFFSKNLKYLREKKNLDQQKVADDLKIPQSTLSCWENGIRTPKIEQILDIANYFNVEMDIISKDYSKIKNDIVENEDLYNEYTTLIDEYKGLSKNDKELIKNIIKIRKQQNNKESEEN